MNTLLKITPLILAAALPATVVTNALGYALPTLVDPLHVFSALVASLTILTWHADYRAHASWSERVLARQAAKQPHRFPLAA